MTVSAPSLDGGRAVQDRQRPLRLRSSHDALLGPVQALLREPGLAQVGARATVMRGSLGLFDNFHDILETDQTTGDITAHPNATYYYRAKTRYPAGPATVARKTSEMAKRFMTAAVSM